MGRSHLGSDSHTNKQTQWISSVSVPLSIHCYVTFPGRHEHSSMSVRIIIDQKEPLHQLHLGEPSWAYSQERGYYQSPTPAWVTASGRLPRWRCVPSLPLALCLLYPLHTAGGGTQREVRSQNPRQGYKDPLLLFQGTCRIM